MCACNNPLINHAMSDLGNLSLTKQPDVPALFVEHRGPLLIPGLASSVNALSGSNLEFLTPQPLSTAVYTYLAFSSTVAISS